MTAWRYEAGDGTAVLAIVDHASNHVPEGIDLAIDASLLETHIGWDIGAEALAKALGFPVFASTISRLVVDFNREAEDSGIVPLTSDGVAIHGNHGDPAVRIDTYWRPYHAALAQRIALDRPHLLLSVHSFTPTLATRPDERRPWEIGILYNRDDRAARIAIELLATAGVVVGDQLPYSGKLLNATLNRHGEGTGTPYLGLEVRQDLIGDEAGIAKWASLLRPVVLACLDALRMGGKATS